MARTSRKTGVAQTVNLAHIYSTAVYIRLSNEDLRKKNSGSADTQRAMLIDFIKTQPDLQLYAIYEDVNYTGTNFNRPGFLRMLRDIEAGLADCVLVKDLSRFGRRFWETGDYLERVFPLLEVRFISLADNYDTKTESDESGLIVPLKNLINETYARDISRKVSSAVKQKQQRGEFCGSTAPYGYVKSGVAFAIDNETAPVVRLIFDWVIEGLSDTAVARRLNDFGIMPPGRYRFEKGIIKTQRYKNSELWYKSAVGRIAENPVYLGKMVQGRQKSDFPNSSRSIRTNPAEWITVENTHPAIIDEETFEAVQAIRKARRIKHE